MSAQGLEDPRVSALSEVSLQAFVAHRAGVIVYANSGFCALFGFDGVEQAKAAPLTSLLGDVAGYGAQAAAIACYGRRLMWRRDGRPFMAEYYARAVAWLDGPAIAIALTDVTGEEAAFDAREDRRAESAMRLKADAHVARLVAFGRRVRSGDDSARAALAATAEAAESLTLFTGEGWHGPRMATAAARFRIAAATEDRALARGLEREGLETVWMDPAEPPPSGIRLAMIDLETWAWPLQALPAILRRLEGRGVPVAAIAPEAMHAALAESGVAAVASRPLNMRAFVRTLRLLARSVEAAEFDQVHQENRGDETDNNVDGEHGGPRVE